MDNFTATAAETAYKNGYEKGYEEGETEATRRILMFLESQMTDNKRCKCERLTRSKFYPYCPYCGEKY